MESVYGVQRINLGGTLRRAAFLPSQRILDFGEVANAHHLENQPVDVGFEFSQSQGAGAFLPRGCPVTGAVGSFRGFLVFCRWRLPSSWSSR